MTSTELPRFRQMNPHGFYYDDTLWPEGTEFFYSDTPNDFLEPLNEPARDAMDKWCAELDELHRKYCEKMNRPFVERPRSWEEGTAMRREDITADMRAREEGRAIKKISPVKRPKPPPQAHLMEAGNTFAPAKRIQTREPGISGVKMPEAPSPNEKPIAILGKDFEQTLSIRG